MRAINLLLLFIVAAFGAPSFSAQQTNSQPQNESATPARSETASVPGSTTASGSAPEMMGPQEFLLGPGDVLDLRVFGETQFDGPLDVNSEGNIEVPFVETPIRASCRNIRDVSKDVKVALARFLKNPQVSLRVKEKGSRRPAVIYGAIRTPAQFQMYRRARLLELISSSGGVTEQANGTIQIFHTEPVMCPEPGTETTAAAQEERTTDPTQIPFTVYRIADLKQGKEEGNPFIRPGDIVYVAEASPVYITGSVIQPQGLYLHEQLSLTRALAMVGGTRKGAKTSEIRILRQKPGVLEPEVIKVNYAAIKKNKEKDFPLQAYDIVEVPDESGAIVTLKSIFLGVGTTFPNSAGAVLATRILY